ncbi:MAG TPA: PilZ domain-containing protein [Polyangiaceae bacterium]|nr:PilZ domain-containing protein [Polyangiaceae bacterium]
MTEQRKHHRVPVQIGVTCIPGDGEEFEGAVKDLSLGGMFVECERRPVFGSNVTLVLRGVAARELRLPAIVRWSEPRGFGVQFGLLGAYATHAILELVKKSSS